MDPATITLIASILLKYGPDTAAAIVNIFRKPAPSPDDWDNVFALARKGYDEYVAPKPPA